MFERYSLKPLTTKCGTPHLRVIPWLIAAPVYGFLVWAILAADNDTKLVCGVLLAVGAGWNTHKFFKEQKIISYFAIAIGTITSSERMQSGEGYVYAIEYEFKTADCEIYVGSAESTKEQPGKGAPIIVVYNRLHPYQSCPSKLFLFYKFSAD